MGLRAILLSIFLAVVPISAQSWESLRAFQGQTVKVRDASGEERKGICESVSADAITLQTGTSQVSIEKAKVRRVQVSSAARRWRNLAIGAGIGLAIGVTVDQTLGTYLRNEGHDSTRAVTYVAPIGLFGALGAAMGPYRTVYQVR